MYIPKGRDGTEAALNPEGAAAGGKVHQPPIIQVVNSWQYSFFGEVLDTSFILFWEILKANNSLDA